ncbi:hypothetical protein NC652_026261 [Populus alba x Populus x berolinensis]|uniref:Uncharacterized protein n=1 Tax=Populus alba x Populus x berolinensis TaxID=444605 RepID=A0AAD6QAF6_9ROSI|nr:hypothetical protein NC652_026261 [Populus alba x Populus x berolinensis]KAJ6982853.1 hypothetical protein NC653_025845 [Populus alba x Populus x berolinensis]
MFMTTQLLPRVAGTWYFRFETADEAVRALHHAGAISVILSIPDSSDEAEIETCLKYSQVKKSSDILERLGLTSNENTVHLC